MQMIMNELYSFLTAHICNTSIKTYFSTAEKGQSKLQRGKVLFRMIQQDPTSSSPSSAYFYTIAFWNLIQEEQERKKREVRPRPRRTAKEIDTTSTPSWHCAEKSKYCKKICSKDPPTDSINPDKKINLLFKTSCESSWCIYHLQGCCEQRGNLEKLFIFYLFYFIVHGWTRPSLKPESENLLEPYPGRTGKEKEGGETEAKADCERD